MAAQNGNGHRRVRLALVGCGYWGPKVVRASASVPEVEVAALIDRDLRLAENLQRNYTSARVADSLTDVLENEEVDAVIVATPPETHTEVAAEALMAGKHVLVEKPLARSADDCRLLGSLAEERDLRLMVGHTFRFSPAVRMVRQLLDARELGEVYYVDSQRLNLGRVRKDVDAIWNFAPHDISIINHWLGGTADAVTCHAYDYLQPGIPDLAFLILEYGSVVVHVQISWLSPSKVRHMTVVGSRKMIVYDDVASQVVLHDAGIDRERVEKTLDDFTTFDEFRLIQRVGDMYIPRIKPAEPLAVQARHFLECIETGSQPITNFEEASGVVQVLEAASESHQNGGARISVAAAI
jgi:predicted dehydrogenase